MTEQIFHIGIKGLILNQHRELLVLHETSSGGSLYDIPGGRIEGGENPLETLARELREEIGVGIFEVVGRPLVARSPKRLSIPEGEMALMLVAFPICLRGDREPAAQEPNVKSEWRQLAEAELLLRDKYPEDFCREIGKLKV